MAELLAGVNNRLICNVQSLGIGDCNSPLVSDGQFWTCPYGHIQGFDALENPVRKIVDRRTSVKQGRR